MIGLSKIMFPVLGFFATIAGGGYVANYLGFLPKQNYLDLSHWKESNTFANYIEKVNGESNNFSCTKWFMQEEKSKSEKISENDCQKLIKSLSSLKENSQLERLLIVNKGKLKEVFSEYFLTIPEMVDLLLNGNYEGNWMYRDLTCKKEEKFEKSIISCFKQQQNNT